MAFQPYCPQASPIVTNPTQVVNSVYHPQLVPVIHPVEIINQHHCVPVYQHMVTYSVKNEMCRTSGMRSKKR